MPIMTFRFLMRPQQKTRETRGPEPQNCTQISEKVQIQHQMMAPHTMDTIHARACYCWGWSKTYVTSLAKEERRRRRAAALVEEKEAAFWLQWKRFANCTVARNWMPVMKAAEGLEFGSHMLKMAPMPMIRTRRPCLWTKFEIDWNRADAARLSWKAKTKSQRGALV